MVETVTVTTFLCVHSVAVELEVIVGCVDSNTDRTHVVHGIEEGDLAARLDGSVRDTAGDIGAILRHAVPFLRNGNSISIQIILHHVILCASIIIITVHFRVLYIYIYIYI